MNTQTIPNTMDLLYTEHFPSLLREAYRLCGDTSQADDLALETLYHAAERFATFRGGSLRAWLGTILRNRFRDDCRRRRHTIALDALDGDVLIARAPSPEAQFLSHSLIQEALAACHDPDLFQAAVFGGDSLTEISRETGENLNTITARDRRDRKRLRDCLPR